MKKKKRSGQGSVAKKSAMNDQVKTWHVPVEILRRESSMVVVDARNAADAITLATTGWGAFGVFPPPPSSVMLVEKRITGAPRIVDAAGDLEVPK